MDIETGDRVRVTTKNSRFEGMIGTVINVHEGKDASFAVEFEQTLPAGRFTSAGSITGFFVSELEPVDPGREALIELAETLDKARRQANASGNPEIESQRGVYGTIAMALGNTLAELVGHGKDATRYATSDRVYDAILDGSTVREALAQVVK